MLDEIARQVEAAGYPWAWDEAPPDWFLAQQRGQMDLFDFMPLCVGCQARKEAA